MRGFSKTVVLFGAGAALEWGGPTTSYLTAMTRKVGTLFTGLDGQTATELIYQTLLKSGHSAEDINFETLVNAIDELISHYAYFDGKRKTSSISRTLLHSNFGDDFWDFDIYGGEETHGYRLNIPKGTTYDYAEYSINNESPHQFYFQHLLSLMLININARVSKYSYTKSAETAHGDFTTINSAFGDWYRQMSNDSIVRMYTLNYDRNFKLIAAHLGYDIFEGFSEPSKVGSIYHDGRLELDKILNREDIAVHYNLHGSSFWNVHPRDQRTQLNNMWVSLNPYISLSSISSSPVLQINRGQSVQVSNIITGYHKTQKSFATPFRQMQAAFDRDCMLGDRIVVIGYSFGDFHINSSIVNALKYNKKVKLEFVDPAYSEVDGRKGYDLLVDRLIHIFSDFFKNKRTRPIYSLDKMCCTYFEDRLKVSMMGFKQYLTEQHWKI
ncbi:hypothetical protein WBG78_20745 [Chryseolinea sp. T2]|uniref:hypothetical protein n=1 Tax=Chryseolinea sp. T2 TaxID=3129255 RepID=UPI00307881F1